MDWDVSDLSDTTFSGSQERLRRLAANRPKEGGHMSTRWQTRTALFVGVAALGTLAAAIITSGP